MEKGIEAEEDNLYKKTEDVSNNVLDSLDGMNANIKINRNLGNETSNQAIDYKEMFNILYNAFLKALNSCRLSLDEDGFVKLIKNELYEVL